MPYVDKGDKICKPGEKEVEVGDIILVQPALLKVRRYLIEFPPLSIVSEKCKNEIESPNWVEGYTVTGKEDVEVHQGEKEVEGEIEVKCPRLLPAITAKHALGKIKIQIHEGVEGIPLVEISGFPLITVKGGKVILATSQYQNYLKAVAYTVYYYISSSSGNNSS